MCYNHLAGKLGVALSQALVEQEMLAKVDGGYLVTEPGERWLQEIGVDCSTLKKQGQLFAPHHIDWSERLYHVAGALGAALAQCFLARGWLRRAPNSRAVRLTEEGERVLLQELGLRLSVDKDVISA